MSQRAPRSEAGSALRVGGTQHTGAVASFDQEAQKIHEKMRQVTSFIRENELPLDLGRKVRSFFKHVYTTSKRFKIVSSYDTAEIFSDLPQTLRAAVILQVERALVEKIPFFQNKSDDFIADTLTHLQPHYVQKGDLIVREGSKAEEMYFLVRGRAAVVLPEHRKHEQRKMMVEGSYFGEVGLLMGGRRTASIEAITPCELQLLNGDGFDELLLDYPDVKAELVMTAARRHERFANPDASSNLGFLMI